MSTLPNRLFVGIYPTGVVYADRAREKHGDYMRLAFLPFHTLVLEWTPEGVCSSPELRAAIEADVRAMQARRGEAFEVSACGQTVTLAGKAGSS